MILFNSSLVIIVFTSTNPDLLLCIHYTVALRLFQLPYTGSPDHKQHHAWKDQADKLSAREISKDDYDRWRYYYPKYDTTQLWAKVPSQELSDTMVEAFQDKPKKDE